MHVSSSYSPAVVGEHWLVEFTGCKAELLNSADQICAALTQACTHSGLTLLSTVSHQFTPQGITALGLLAESHISIHTWPEHNYAAIDIFSCGDTSRLQPALDTLLTLLQPAHHTCTVIQRGMGLQPPA